MTARTALAAALIVGAVVAVAVWAAWEAGAGVRARRILRAAPRSAAVLAGCAPRVISFGPLYGWRCAPCGIEARADHDTWVGAVEASYAHKSLTCRFAALVADVLDRDAWDRSVR